jgi:hypothetical protein
MAIYTPGIESRISFIAVNTYDREKPVLHYMYARIHDSFSTLAWPSRNGKRDTALAAYESSVK